MPSTQYCLGSGVIAWHRFGTSLEGPGFVAAQYIHERLVEFLLVITEADDRGTKDGVWRGLFSEAFKRARIAVYFRESPRDDAKS